MRILEAIATLGPGGAESLVCDLSIELAGKAADVKILLTAGIRGERGELQKKRLNDAGIEIIQQNLKNPRSFSSLSIIYNTLKYWNPDIVHCHLYNTEVAFVLTKLLLKNRSIFLRTIHNTDIVGTRSEIISRFLVNQFDFNIACSPSVEESYRRFVKSKKASNSLKTISNGCVLSDYITGSQGKNVAREQLSLPQDSFIFCSVGAFRGSSLEASQKAQDIALKGFAGAFKNDLSALLVFAGDGPLKEEAKSIARECGIERQVRFLGNIPESWPLLRASDVFLMPSRHEGLPIALLEAASTGLPVIASDIPEISSLVTNNNWLLCPVDNEVVLSTTMMAVTKNYPEYLNLARDQASIIRENYTIKRCAQNYWNLFTSISNKKR